MFDEYTAVVLLNVLLFEKKWASKFELHPMKRKFYSSQFKTTEVSFLVELITETFGA